VVVVAFGEALVIILLTVYIRTKRKKAVKKAPADTELTKTSEPVTAVVYESIDERRSQPLEILTESPLYQSHGTVQTNAAYSVKT
jgi:hypothetical protein